MTNDQIFVRLYNELGAYDFLNALWQALGSDEQLENARFIAQMWDIDIKTED